jgi:RNA-dependent RNA polymerase
MNELGISAKIFLDLFAEAVKEVDGMAKRVVAKTETQADIRRADQLSDWPVRTMLKYGFNRDPCLQDLLRVIECRTLSDLRWRARLEIKQGVYLLGIPDELEILKEGEVFCQYRNPDDLDDDLKVVTGLAIICRAPALHPGDIRRVKAVDRPELHHLRNVIVFSTRGQRDLPNMLGGGDLDGDDYSLIWDPRLIHNYDTPPMDYSAPPPKEVAVITAKDLQDNFVDYLKVRDRPISLCL